VTLCIPVIEEKKKRKKNIHVLNCINYYILLIGIFSGTDTDFLKFVFILLDIGPQGSHYFEIRGRSDFSFRC
jgi:hypothetical protein